MADAQSQALIAEMKAMREQMNNMHQQAQQGAANFRAEVLKNTKSGTRATNSPTKSYNQSPITACRVSNS